MGNQFLSPDIKRFLAVTIAVGAANFLPQIRADAVALNQTGDLNRRHSEGAKGGNRIIRSPARAEGFIKEKGKRHQNLKGRMRY